jgi:hypothetical protein
MLTSHYYQDIHNMRNNNFYPNGLRHSMLGIIHMGDCCCLSHYNISNTMINGYQGNNFQFRTKYG